MTPKEFVKELEIVLKKNANARKAEEMKQYLLGQFPFFGIQKPLRDKLCKPLYEKIKTVITEKWILETTGYYGRKRKGNFKPLH